ncbi:MAG: cytochrome C [Actinobacteria bacterium]|nr:cytochrome C [Actinomycetota bacterium]
MAAGIAGSDHDFSGSSWSGGKICAPCHTPHDANTSVSGAPLWNHAVSVATYTVYSSTTLNASVGQPSGTSKLCLSCHDGTVAIDSFGGATGTNMITGDSNLGTDLSGSHPVSFTYNSALATDDGGLFDPATDTTSLGGTIDEDLLIGSKLECASCHDVHDELGNEKLLQINNVSSALCLTCHDM